MNIVSFSLFGNHKVYTKGMIENIVLMPDIYPTFTARVYIERNHPAISVLQDLGAQTIEMPMDRKWRSAGLFWRFLVAADPNVHIWLIRDADSRINVREASAVREWLQGDKGYHTMHDHRHHICTMMAGMWGGRKRIPLMPSLIEKYSGLDIPLADQVFLKELIWPVVRDDVQQHKPANWPEHSEYVGHVGERVGR